MRTATLLFVFVFGLSSIARSQTRSPLELTDIFDMEYASDPQISPDGKKIVYVRNFKDIMTDRNLSNLWMVHTDGSQHRPLTTGNQNDTYPRWSHDGTKIIFKSNKEDNKTKIYLMWMDTKETAALTNTPKPPGAISWSRDDRFLAFTMFVPEKSSSPITLPNKPEAPNGTLPRPTSPN